MPLPGWTFTEKSFYLAEFRGRSLAIALPDPHVPSLAPLDAVLRELAENQTRVVLLSPHAELLEKAAEGRVLQQQVGPDWPGRLWRMLGGDGCVGVRLASGDFAAQCREMVLRMRPAKLVWLDRRGSVQRSDGRRISVLDLADLRGMLEGRPASNLLLSEEHPRLLEEIAAMLDGGLPAVNVCHLEALADELFTYAGAGTFLARERYAEVRALALDDFDAAADLIARGVEEGYLVPRDPAATEHVLSNGFGVFIEGRYLAGIGSLLPHTSSRAGELASLYTVTRFLGEGVGGHLIRHTADRAAEHGYAYVFACTTSPRVEGFFHRHGFRTVGSEEIPAEKWAGYAEERRGRVRCLRRDL